MTVHDATGGSLPERALSHAEAGTEAPGSLRRGPFRTAGKK